MPPRSRGKKQAENGKVQGSQVDAAKSGDDRNSKVWRIFVPVLGVFFAMLYLKTNESPQIQLRPSHCMGAPMGDVDTNLIDRRVADKVSNATKTKDVNPVLALSMLHEAVEEGGFGMEACVTVLDAFADTHALLQQDSLDCKMRQDSLPVRRAFRFQQCSRTDERSCFKANVSMALGLTLAANACKKVYDQDIPLTYVKEALDMAGSLPPKLVVLAHQIKSEVHKCADDFVSASKCLDIVQKVDPNSAKETRHIHQHASLLRSALSSDLSGADRIEVRKKMQKLTSKLLKIGPWERIDQLPNMYVPGLLAKAWHTMDDFPRLSEWSRIVQESKEELLHEFDVLKQRGLLLRESECIHSRKSGDWVRFDVNGVWQERDSDNCATAAPAACKLFKRLKDMGMPLLRAGYSALAAKSWLKPHCGQTNSQLKWHLGLRVPDGACATMRVGNETQAWSEGNVLFFDDSFEHEVWNNCDSERVVFQIVFEHPGLSKVRGGRESIKQAYFGDSARMR
eukprot:TRINITY_DN28538_c0_g1_i1.p1 TRINITY_DN28538_c0_g1~~TRINITY_DN28538_c0_g1_i1.p1  ORF type:complete len:510 (-),score=71.56 TRINITY_DN28538_c0_g1_i1:188-1717(-)